MFEVSKQFRFDAAHTLQREIDAEPSRRIHGHSYRAEVTIRGMPDPKSGMLMDLGLLEQAVDKTRHSLDHHFLDEVRGLGPATLENLCAWIWNDLTASVPKLACITIYRDSSGEKCTYFGPSARHHE